MLERFYQRYSLKLAALVFATLPGLLITAMQLRPSNDIETWMPESDPARVCYEEFKRAFGVEEFVLIGFDRREQGHPDASLIEALCARLERLPEVRRCWSLDRMAAMMQEFGVDRAAAEIRVQRLLVGQDGNVSGVVALLSPAGYRDRTLAVQRIREELRYCLLDGNRTLLAGPPLFVAELDRLGGTEANTRFLTVTLGICLGILYYLIRDWKLTGLVFLLTVWTIDLTVVVLHLAGVEINLLLSSVPILVMVLTMSVSVHYLFYYREALNHRAGNAVVEGIRAAWWPTLIGTVTTCIGELALSVSDIAPIRHFAYAASLGSVLSMAAGLGITPALVTICPSLPRRAEFEPARYSRLATWIVSHSRVISAATMALTLLAGWGLVRLRADMTVAEYLPDDSKVRRDFERVERELTAVDSVEVVVRFDDDRLPFVAKLERVRKIEAAIRQYPAVAQTMSLADFFPDPLPQDPITLLSVLKKALEHREHHEFAAEGESVWRISARVHVSGEYNWQRITDDLRNLLDGEPAVLTGMAVLFNGTQREIFNSFWQSILVALALITVAIMVFLRSIRTGITAMIPNLAPLIWIYGLLGWLGWPIDIAMMLAGSIALGLSVDGTFHFMSHFRMHLVRTGSPNLATRNALLESSIPFSQATLTSTAGMFGLTLSTFAPTAHFGWLMIALMLAALVGDVVMLPALVRAVCSSGPRESGPPAPTSEVRPPLAA